MLPKYKESGHKVEETVLSREWCDPTNISKEHSSHFLENRFKVGEKRKTSRKMHSNPVEGS